MTARKKKPKRSAPRTLFALFDVDSEFCGMYETKQEALGDAWGPRFRTFSVRQYQLISLDIKSYGSGTV